MQQNIAGRISPNVSRKSGAAAAVPSSSSKKDSTHIAGAKTSYTMLHYTILQCTALLFHQISASYHLLSVYCNLSPFPPSSPYSVSLIRGQRGPVTATAQWQGVSVTAIWQGSHHHISAATTPDAE